MSATLEFSLLGWKIYTLELKLDAPTDNPAQTARKTGNRLLNRGVKGMSNWWCPRMTSND